MAAAKQDPNKQSLYSRQIKELENALSIELLDRTSSPAKPTELAQKISNLYTEFEEGLRREVQRYSEQKTARIGAGESVIQWLVIPLLAQSPNSSNIHFEFNNLRSTEIIQKLKTGQLDIGIISRPHSEKTISSQPITNLALKLIGPKCAFPKKLNTIEDLEGCSLAALTGAPIPTEVLDKIQFSCSSYAQLLELANHSNTISIVSDLCSKSAKDLGLHSQYFSPLAESKIQLHLVWNESTLTPWAADLVKLIGRSKT